MRVINQESTIFIDVDDTLVMWGKSGVIGKDLIEITDPHYGKVETLAPHKGHIKVLKDRKARGSFIVVWSAGGFAWAEAVITALGLTDYVDLIMTKPHIYIDDKMPDSILGERLYIPHGNGYGE